METLRSITARTRIFELPCDLKSVAAMCAEARVFLSQSGLCDPDVDGWELVIAEACNNAVNATPAPVRNLPVLVEFTVEDNGFVSARVGDHTGGFDWPAKASLPPDDAESGRGIFLIQSLTDESNYYRGLQGNCLHLRRKHLLAGKKNEADELPALKTELSHARETLDLLTNELASSYESLAAIFSFSAELQTGEISKDFVDRWLLRLLAVTKSDWCVLRLADTSTGLLQVVCTTGVDQNAPQMAHLDLAGPLSSIEANAAMQRMDVWFEGVSDNHPEDPLAPIAKNGFGLSHPLFVNDVLVGILSIGRIVEKSPLPAGQVNVIQTFGDFLAMQIRSTQIQEEQLESRLNSRDLEIAGRIQRALLPEQLPVLPKVEMDVYYRSAREIGGDYYDILTQDDGNALLIIADVMGKGLPAALFASMFRSLVRSRPDLARSPGGFLAWLNDNLFHELDRSEMFITAQLAYLDCGKAEIRVSSAGHPPMLLGNESGEIHEISAGGPPIGIASQCEFPEERRSFAGSFGLLFTDGLFEARNLSGGVLGLKAVKSLVSDSILGGYSCGSIKQSLAALLEAYQQGGAPQDDTAFLLIDGRELQ